MDTSQNIMWSKKQNKTRHERYILCDYVYIKFKNRQNASKVMKPAQWLPLTESDIKELFGVWKMLYILTGLLVIWVYIFVNIHLKLSIALYVHLPHLKETPAPNFALIWHMQKIGLPRSHFSWHWARLTHKSVMWELLRRHPMAGGPWVRYTLPRKLL